jgi:DNA-binding GntR family transcriptional regulator
MKPPRRALRHDVRDGIVRSILDGEYRPGDRLIEMQIAKAYGTSQGPVREALRELEMLGFVRSEMHRGTYVRDPWHLGMRELFQVRGALEEFAARLATPRLSEDV